MLRTIIQCNNDTRETLNQYINDKLIPLSHTPHLEPFLNNILKSLLDWLQEWSLIEASFKESPGQFGCVDSIEGIMMGFKTFYIQTLGPNGYYDQMKMIKESNLDLQVIFVVFGSFLYRKSVKFSFFLSNGSLHFVIFKEESSQVKEIHMI